MKNNDKIVEDFDNEKWDKEIENQIIEEGKVDIKEEEIDSIQEVAQHLLFEGLKQEQIQDNIEPLIQNLGEMKSTTAQEENKSEFIEILNPDNKNIKAQASKDIKSEDLNLSYIKETSFEGNLEEQLEVKITSTQKEYFDLSESDRDLHQFELGKEPDPKELEPQQLSENFQENNDSFPGKFTWH